MSTPTFFIHTLGCKVNRAESETLAAGLLALGWMPAASARATLAVLSTCTVTGEADAKNRKVLRALLRQGPQHVIVTGCAVNLDADAYASLDERITCVADKEQLPEVAQRLVSQQEAGVREPPAASNPLGAQEFGAAHALASNSSPSTRPLFRTRVDVKVQDGCNNACSYCIVHAARGPARSEPADAVVARVAQLAESGTQEVVLVGIDIGAYRDGALDLTGLLRRLLAETGIGRVRVSSIEPQSLEPSLVDVLTQAGGRVCRHLHLCLQSGSTAVLQQMNRGYSAGEFAELVSAARARIPGLALSTDVIVGFPGETDEDFERTCQLVSQCGFMRLHVFRYSKRPGTPAAERADQVPPQVMAARATRLRELGAALAERDAQTRIGTTEQVIVERPGRGTAESYHSVAFEAEVPNGAFVPMRFTSYDVQRGLLIAKPC